MPDDRKEKVGFRVSVGPRTSPERAAPAPQTPFRIAVLGDFSGGGVGGALADRRTHRVDRDNLDQVLARLAPEVRLPTDPPNSVRFASLQDFHPDSLYHRIPLFQKLREARERLADPASSAEAVRELLGGESPSAAAPEGGPPPASGDLLDRILDRTAPPAVEAEAALAGDLSGLVRQLVRPYLEGGVDPRSRELQESLDGAASGLMRALLHHPHVQALEAAWRGVDFLVRRLETDARLQLHLIDVSRDELAADQAPDSDIEGSGLYKLLVESSVGTPGGEPWALIIGDYTFGPEPDDLLLLARLGALASLAEAPWISAAGPGLAGAASFADPPDPAAGPPAAGPLWDALRREPQAAWLGLVLPRLLLRLPYGPESEPAESFAFQELSDPPRHGQFLWGNAAFACALLLARSFSDAGWAMAPGLHQDIDRLPLHLVRQADGEVVTQPCGETLLTERAADLLLERGLMPLASMKGSDRVRLVRFQSIRNPLTPLQGRWSGETPHDA